MITSVVKRLTAMLMLAVLMACLCACGSKKADTVSMYDLRNAMLEADSSLPDMTSVSSSDEDAAELFTYLSDLDYDKVDSYFLSYSSEGKADEIAVIAVKDTGDVDEAKATLEDQVADRKALYQSYDPSQLERVEKAMVFTKDQYAVLIICDNSSDVKAAFEDFIK